MVPTPCQSAVARGLTRVRRPAGTINGSEPARGRVTNSASKQEASHSQASSCGSMAGEHRPPFSRREVDGSLYATWRPAVFCVASYDSNHRAVGTSHGRQRIENPLKLFSGKIHALD